MSFKISIALSLSICAIGPLAHATEPDQLPATYLTTAKPRHYTGPSIGAGGVLGRRSTGGLLGIDSIPNWSSYFYFPGLDSFGNTQFAWTYTMVGNAPFGQGDDDNSTSIHAPLVPVTMDLRNADGTPRFVNGNRLIYSPAAFVAPTLNSPVFQNAVFNPGDKPAQFADAVMRAEFGRSSDDVTHTVLAPEQKRGRTMILNRGTYRFGLNPDGTCCAFILTDINAFTTALFPPGPGDTTTVMGQAETAGDVRTTDISTFLFPNTFLYQNGDVANCCVIGFHSYDVEPGSASNGFKERRYVMAYASWVSPGIFGDPTFGDVEPLSHEMVELYNDPFVNNFVPWWISPNGNCQNDLETGDVIEGLPNANFAVPLKGATYHVQNEALLQWFAGQTPSSAARGAYSYPDKSILTTASKSQTVGCK